MIKLVTRGDRVQSPFPKPRVTLKVERKLSSFLVDTGAQYSVLLQPEGALSYRISWAQGATGMKQNP